MIWLLLGVLLVVVSGYHKAVIDTLAEHFFISVFRHKDPKKWHKDFSSENKYESIKWINKKYFRVYLFAMLMKKTLFVWTTDAWHRFQMYYLTCSTIGWFIIGWSLLKFIDPSWYWYAIVYFAVRTSSNWIFEAFHSHFLIDQEEVKKRKYMEGVKIREDLNLENIDKYNHSKVVELIKKIKNGKL